MMVAQGIPCLGPITQAGCGALCPAYERGCYGCFGPMEAPNAMSLTAKWIEMGVASDDVVRALLLAGANASTHGDVFNLGHPEPVSLLEFVRMLQKLARFEFELVPFPPEAEAIDVGDYFGAFEKFRAATGWSPEIDLEAGLESTLRYYRDLGWPTGS